MTWIKVKFGGSPFYVQEEVLKSGSGALAPPEHIKDGELNPETCLDTPTYAHVFPDDKVWRMGQIIGNRSDLMREP